MALIEALLGLHARGVAPFVLATLSPGGTIFHPARIFELLGQGDAHRQRFYADWGALASAAYMAMDRELADLRQRLGCDLPGLDAAGHYGVDTPLALTQRIRALAGLPDVDTPFRDGGLDRSHRFVAEDIPFGLGVACDIARRNGLATPAMIGVRDAIAAAR